MTVADEHGRPGGLRVALSGGGTGGHVYPNLAILGILDRAGMVERAVYLGMPGSAEETIVGRRREQPEIAFRRVVSAPMAGSTRLQQARALPRLALGTLQAAVELLRFRPHLVLVAGSYAAAPTVVAAFLLKPLLGACIVVEEQNLVPGLLNKLASLLADVVFVNYDETVFFLWGRRCVKAGYPVRSAFLEPPPGGAAAARQELGLPADRTLVLVVGGSMGARNLNQALARSLPELEQDPSLLVVHAIGLRDDAEYAAFADTRARLEEACGGRVETVGDELVVRRADGQPFYRGVRFLDPIVGWQRAADLVVTRGGAGTLAEIEALGAAALVVPKRGLPGDHQELNAVAIAKRGACEVLYEQRAPGADRDVVDPRELAATILALAADPGRRRALGARAATLLDRSCHQTFLDAIRRVVAREPVTFLIEPLERPDIVRFQGEFDQVVTTLDGLARTAGWEQDPYHKLYSTKVDEYRTATDFDRANRGVKLIGVLRRADLYPFLVERLASSPPFMRRNTMEAFARAAAFHECFRPAIRTGLADGYWETRREAVKLYRRFHQELAGDRDLQAVIRGLLRRRWERYDVRAEAIRAAVTFLPEAELLEALRPFLASRRVRLRQAVLDAILWGVANGRLVARERVQAALRQTLVTTSEFRPEFAIRRQLKSVLDELHRR